jgi:hypothetical protein
MKIEKVQHTNILPLRWFGNFCNLYLSSWALRRALRHEYKDPENNPALQRAWRLYNILDKTYKKWGTTYKVTDWYTE